ncbi:hypothetical protein NNJEOMEG_01369 [Fundidesulfovibrio magnetotacticus]|uniref:Calcineurin-like phosphoesterase domain-containing protein n=1 Tax=Fundidesulfovibrio magnetotacticus TaxID=2730080 RepID=A0A6V8LZ79_9BACT|nr:metallophosphoesterase family protein [Fundidesulfovibrio magnetotacticus]GFK93535.1 hypothetical protein NNJEOMEG_01369 [Fundidesulfovibrio magnetotacticus]
MVLIVLSDIHANLEALEAVLEDAGRLAPPDSPVICLGDLVGYGADPDAVVSLVRARQALAVRGNHEMGVADPKTRRRFNPLAWDAVRWAGARLSPDNLRWVASLPIHLSLEGCRFVHGLPPDEVDTYLFQASSAHVGEVMAQLPETVCFIGHTHQLRLVSLAPDGLRNQRIAQGSYPLDPSWRHLVNAGSVGQPRDGDPRAKYCLFDTEASTLTVHSVEYDAARAARKILDSGQPRAFALFLADPD